ncbi:MAG: tetratricopeptide repeat protein [Isosphaeraceae bacterium]
MTSLKASTTSASCSTPPVSAPRRRRCTSGRAIQEKLCEAEPAATQYQADLATCHNSIGNLLNDTGRSAEALVSYERSRQIREKLCAANPAVTRYQADLAGSHNNIGMLLRAIGKPAEALQT